MEYWLECYVVARQCELCQGLPSWDLRPRGSPHESMNIDGFVIGFMFTSYGEDVHLWVEPLAILNSRGPNESWRNGSWRHPSGTNLSKSLHQDPENGKRSSG
jgi:hypothetical protein